MTGVASFCEALMLAKEVAARARERPSRPAVLFSKKTPLTAALAAATNSKYVHRIINPMDINGPIHWTADQFSRSYCSSLAKGTTMPAILYKQKASPPARAVMMLIDILGLNHIEQRNLNPLLREQDEPEIKKKNPMRTIPLLDEGDFWLADSHAIMIYLLEKYGKPEQTQLYPTDSRKRATVHQRLFFDCGVLFERLRAVMAPTYMGRLTEMSKGMIRNIEDAYSTLEDYLSENLYMASDVMTIADLSIVSTMATLVGLVPIDEKRFPKLKQWYDNMNKTDYCQKINIPGGKEHSDGLKALMENTKFYQQSRTSKL